MEKVDTNFENCIQVVNFCESQYEKAFWVTEEEFRAKIKQSDVNFGNLTKLVDFYESQYKGFFQVLEYKFSVKICIL